MSKQKYDPPVIYYQGSAVMRTCGADSNSLEPVALYRPVSSDTASAEESADGMLTGAESSNNVNSRSNE